MKVTIEVELPSPFFESAFDALVRTRGQLRKDEASRLVHLSPSRFGHKFKEDTGVNFQSTRLRIKLDIGSQLLDKMTVTEVAQELGYGHRSKFDKAFKKVFGVTPGEYRLNPFIPKIAS